MKLQLERQTEENVAFQIRCTQLERDLHQIQLSNVSSPRREVIGSPHRMLSPAPESLGFIVERELIEKENENTNLHQTIKDLNEQVCSEFSSPFSLRWTISFLIIMLLFPL